MPMITIKEKEYSYDESEIVSFAEGLIGLPLMRRAVLIPMDEYAPFCWLASIDDEKNRFIVVNPREIFDGYQPISVSESCDSDMKTMAIVKISSDWQKTTVNLRAPIFINRETKRGTQLVLTESSYSLAETIPQS
jgi:flagellar assembly factor FliW